MLLGLVFFGANLGWWSFWNIQWYSALFVLVGVSKLAKGKCKDCCNMCGSMAKGRKR
ncbi:hypothetical protein HYX16_02100 [Candidatus Woesearchaeota archaeon]|nr:hypothetical protein [Candidatus Woesearchaeota archaeon]